MESSSSTSSIEELAVNRKSVAVDAASLGRLTRLQEEVVERTADAKPEQARDAWTLKRASQTALLKSSFHRCVQEAAVVGLLQRHHDPVEVVVTASPPLDAQETTGQQEPNDELQAISLRASQVLEAHVKGSHKEKARTWRSSLATLERLDQQDEMRRAWLEHQEGTNCNACSDQTSPSSLSPLPSQVVPRWRRRSSRLSKDKLKECIANEAANQAFERAWRLENESQHELIVRKGCACVYCSGNPSPYQTQEYQRLQKRHVIAFPSFVNLNDDDLSSIGSASFLDTSSHSSIQTSYSKNTVNMPTSSPPAFHEDMIHRSKTLVSKVHTTMGSRPPRSLTPPRRTSNTAQITKRSSSTPMPTSDVVPPSTTSTTIPPTPPSWVSPLANRKHINYKKNLPPPKRESLLNPPSPCGVSSVIVLERESLDLLNLKASERPRPQPHKRLDGEFDEEQLLREELVSLGIADT